MNLVQGMTYDPEIAYAETDKDYSRTRLGPQFFRLNKFENLVTNLRVFQVKFNPDVLESLAAQQAFIELHEFKHQATRREHKLEEIHDWYQGLYDNCFKPK